MTQRIHCPYCGRGYIIITTTNSPSQEVRLAQLGEQQSRGPNVIQNELAHHQDKLYHAKRVFTGTDWSNFHYNRKLWNG